MTPHHTGEAPQDAEVQLAELSAFVHGVLAGLHLLGIAYNARRRNWFDIAAHTAAAVYDIHAMHSHVADAHDLRSHHVC